MRKLTQLLMTLMLMVPLAGWSSKPLKTYFEKFNDGLELRIGIQLPEQPATADVLYIHGFADRLDNHGPLFQRWAQSGYRVISLDLPSHGETRGDDNNLDRFTFEKLSRLVSFVEYVTREDVKRPLFLAGWSTGGLLALRMAQSDRVGMSRFGRNLAGLILIAPGLSVYHFVGEYGWVTERTLTRNPRPPHRGPITPESPLFVPFFATDLLRNSYHAFEAPLPIHLPTLMLISDEAQDRYVKPERLKEWAVREHRLPGRDLTAVLCRGGYHELDNEPEPMGSQVRDILAMFVGDILSGKKGNSPTATGPCGRLLKR